MSFGRLEKASGNPPMSDINVTPLVDVMLVLLVIFIITAPLMASRLKLDLPKAPTPDISASAPQPDAVTLAIDASGQWHWQDEAVTEDEARRRLQQAAARNADTEVQVRADTTVPYGQIVRLIAMAQQAGLARVGFVTDAATARELQLEGAATAPR